VMRAPLHWRLPLSLSTPAMLATALALACAIAGARLEADAPRGRILVPVSGVLLVAVAIFGVGPEVVRGAGWMATIALAAAAYIGLSMLDLHGHPVCPSSSHGESFAASLAIATGLHAFLDGWGLSVVRFASRGVAPNAILGAILLHKIPEGLMLGAMLRASTPSLANALALAAAAELMTVAGSFVGIWATPAAWVNYPLAIALGMFVFLGMHALRGERHHSH
jgi:zinc transporter ZupT